MLKSLRLKNVEVATQHGVATFDENGESTNLNTEHQMELAKKVPTLDFIIEEVVEEPKEEKEEPKEEKEEPKVEEPKAEVKEAPKKATAKKTTAKKTTTKKESK